MFRRLLVVVFFRSWWVIAFSLFCGALYEKGLKARELNYQLLKEQLSQLQIEKKRSMELQQSLKRQIMSQTDDRWKELVLKRVLGLVAEDEQKVFFYSTLVDPPFDP